MKKTDAILKEIADLIKDSKTIFISGHLRPDGDTVGSQLSLASLLDRLGKKSVVCNADPIPYNLKFLPGIDRIRIEKKCVGNFDLAIILECSDISRAGSIIDIKTQVKKTVNIDHHLSSSNFADVNYVDKDLSSSAEQVYNLFEYLGIEPGYEEALCLYTGILTDTGCFQHSNTSSRAMQIASKLIAAGIRPDWLFQQIYQRRSKETVSFMAYVLNNFRLFLDDRVAVIVLPPEKFGCCQQDSEEVISLLMIMDSVKVGAFVRQSDSEIKVSFRSKENINVARVAEHFGGGGHRNAAGMSLHGDVDEGLKSVLEQIEKELR